MILPNRIDRPGETLGRASQVNRPGAMIFCAHGITGMKHSVLVAATAWALYLPRVAIVHQVFLRWLSKNAGYN